jgi:hypothetical protein
MTISINWYVVLVSEYAKKHFIKNFEKKYKSWNVTFLSIEKMLSHINAFLTTSKVEKIHICDTWYIAKCEFKIIWNNESPRTSWNRIIIYVNEKKQEVHILLLYCKTDVWWWKETAWWEKEIKENHREVYNRFEF